MTSMARVINWNKKAAEIISPIMQSQSQATSYLWPHMHTRIHIYYLCIQTSMNKSNLKNKKQACTSLI